MKNRILALLWLFLCAGAYSQIPECDRIQQSGPEIPGIQYYPDESPSDNLPYIYSQWVQGSVNFRNGQIIPGIHLLFDLHKNLLIYHNDNLNIPEVIDHRLVQSFILNDPGTGRIRRFAWLNLHTFYFSDTTGIFAEVLAEGNFSAYVLRYCDKKIASQVAQQKEQRYYFYPIQVIYIQSNGEFRRFVPGKRNVIRLSGIHKSEIKTYIRTNHLDMKKEDDFARVLTYLNTLK